MIKFKNANNSGVVYINPALVTWIIPQSDQTLLYFGTDNCLVVDELEDVVVARLYGAELDNYTRTGDYSRL